MKNSWLPAIVAGLVAALIWAYLAPAFAQQTVPAEVNGGIYNSTAPALSNFQRAPFQMDSAGNLKVVSSPSPTAGITPVVTSIPASSLVLKTAAGDLYSVYASNVQTSTAGYLQIFNATSAPSDGVVTPLDCAPIPAGGSVSIDYNPGPPAVYSTGIVAVLSSATSCFVKTTGTLLGFIKGAVQ